MSTLANDLSAPLCSLTVSTAEILSVLGNTTTVGVFAFLGLRHSHSPGDDDVTHSYDAKDAWVVELVLNRQTLGAPLQSHHVKCG